MRKIKSLESWILSNSPYFLYDNKIENNGRSKEQILFIDGCW